MKKITEQFTQKARLLRCLRAIQHENNFSVDNSRVLQQIYQHEISQQRVLEQLEVLSRNLAAASWRKAERELERAAECGVTISSVFDADFPACLREIADPPPAIFVRGNISNLALARQLYVGVVGMRRATLYGRRSARVLAADIASAGGTVVSGLARGVDSEAHAGALLGFSACAKKPGASHPATIAVLGSGVCSIYPSENNELAEQILAAGGAIVSEYGIDTNPRAYFFPQRNRLISALSHALVVVQAALRSGSLITARLALEQGKDVFAVPGRLGEEESAGTNKLLRDGGHVYTEFSDILDVLPLYIKKSLAESKAEEELTLSSAKIAKLFEQAVESEADRSVARKVLELLSKLDPIQFDQLVEVSGSPSERLSSVLARLELNGAVSRHPGEFYSLAYES